MNRIFTLVLIAFSVVLSYGQQSWEKVYNDLVAQTFTQTLANKYIMAGSTNDEMVLRWDFIQTDSVGNIESRVPFYRVSVGQPNCLIAAPDSGYVISGYNNDVPYILKFDKENSLEWENEMSVAYYGMCINDMLLKDNAYYAVGGGVFIDNGLFLTKISLAGDTIWTKKYSEFTSGVSLLESYDNKLYCLTDRGTLLKIDSRGDTLWSVPLEDNFIAKSIIKTKDSALVISGNETIGSKLIFTKVDSMGNTIWTKDFLGKYPNNINCCIKKTLNDEFITANYMQPWKKNKSYMWILKLDQYGDSISTIGTTSTELTPVSILQTNDGNFAMLVNDNNTSRLIKTASFEGLFTSDKVDEVTDMAFGVYPNPFNDFLEIKTTQDYSDKIAEVMIFNSVGALVYAQEYDNITELTIKTSFLAKGIYYLHIKGGISFNNTYKLIKE